MRRNSIMVLICLISSLSPMLTACVRENRSDCEPIRLEEAVEDFGESGGNEPDTLPGVPNTAVDASVLLTDPPLPEAFGDGR